MHIQFVCSQFLFSQDINDRYVGTFIYLFPIQLAFDTPKHTILTNLIHIAIIISHFTYRIPPIVCKWINRK